MTEVVQTAATSPDEVPDDPTERAQMRLRRLTSSFADLMVTVAEMHRDEDWKYLTRPDGDAYESLPEVISDAMGVGLAMARRYRQGALDLYLPLSEVTVEGTRIEVSSADVAALGKDGSHEAVDLATERLAGVTDPEEASGIVSGTIDEVKQSRQQSASPNAEFDDPFDDAAGGDATEAQTHSHGGADEFDDIDSTDEFAQPPDSTATTSSATPESEGGNVDSSVAKVLQGGRDYSNPDELATLDEPLRSIAAAIATLSDIDPQDLSNRITYDTRGVISPLPDTIAALTKLHSQTVTQPWFLSKLT